MNLLSFLESAMLTVFIQHPWLAFVVAAVLAALYLWHRSRFILLTCVLWLLYGVYEYLMYARVLCSGECNIRIDLLLLYPALAAVTCAAIVRSFLAARNKLGRRNNSFDSL